MTQSLCIRDFRLDDLSLCTYWNQPGHPWEKTDSSYKDSPTNLGDGADQRYPGRSAHRHGLPQLGMKTQWLHLR